jgi:hypothetical protein
VKLRLLHSGVYRLCGYRADLSRIGAKVIVARVGIVVGDVHPPVVHPVVRAGHPGSAVWKTCGFFQGENLWAKGMSCAQASGLAGADNIKGTEPSGWICADAAIECWTGGTDWSSSTLGFALLPKKGSHAPCAPGEVYVGNAGACMAVPTGCSFTEGFKLTLALTSIGCGTAQRILLAYFNKIQQTGLKNGEVELDDSSGNPIALWVCQGTHYSFGRCRDDTAQQQNLPVQPTFIWNQS